MLLTRNTLFAQNLVLFTSLCYLTKQVFVQYREILKHIFKLKCTVHLIGNNCELPIQTAIFSNPSTLPPAEGSRGLG